MIGLLLCHLTGDYLIQSDYMAAQKTSHWLPAALHAATYGLPFLLLTRASAALAVIVGTHAVIDRYRLARYLVWAKNQLAPRAHRSAWEDCRATGYPSDRPVWLTTWLMIIADNTLHLAIGAAALRWMT